MSVNTVTLPNGSVITTPAELVFSYSTTTPPNYSLLWTSQQQAFYGQVVYLASPNDGSLGPPQFSTLKAPIAIGLNASIEGNGLDPNTQLNQCLAFGYNAYADLFNKVAFGGGSFVAQTGRTASNLPAGDCQSAILNLSGQTTSATPLVLVQCPLGKPTYANQLARVRNGSEMLNATPNGFTYGFTASILARKTDGSQAAFFIRQGIIHNEQSGTCALVGTIQTVGTDINPASWITTPPVITADAVNFALQISVTGLAATTINWLAVVETVEIGS